jgi:hypothetical protein
VFNRVCCDDGCCNSRVRNPQYVCQKSTRRPTKIFEGHLVSFVPYFIFFLGQKSSQRAEIWCMNIHITYLQALFFHVVSIFSTAFRRLETRACIPCCPLRASSSRLAFTLLTISHVSPSVQLCFYRQCCLRPRVLDVYEHSPLFPLQPLGSRWQLSVCDAIRRHLKHWLHPWHLSERPETVLSKGRKLKINTHQISPVFVNLWPRKTNMGQNLLNVTLVNCDKACEACILIIQ